MTMYLPDSERKLKVGTQRTSVQVNPNVRLARWPQSISVSANISTALTVLPQGQMLRVHRRT
jgi:hypothetical protein